MATDPRYMSFDHQYVETVKVTNATNLASGVHAHRFVTRTGAYPAAFAYAAGVTVYDIPGQGVLTDKGYQVDAIKSSPNELVYEGQLNPSTTPYKANVFPYQELLTVVTEGIVIVETAGALAVDGPVSADASGRAQASGTTGGRVILGRALDAASGAGEYVRVKLGDAIV